MPSGIPGKGRTTMDFFRTAAKFDRLVANLQEDKLDLIEQRARKLADRLNEGFYGYRSETDNVYYVGSFSRGTNIRGVSDIDLLVELPNPTYWKFKGYQSNGPSALLQSVRTVLWRRYPRTELKGDGQVVVVDFSDYTKFEVLPAFLNKDGVSFTHPDSNNGGSWRNTHPGSIISEFLQMDRLSGGWLRVLCQMTRAWRRAWDVPISGLLIDTLAYQFVATWVKPGQPQFYYCMFEDFLEYLVGLPSRQAQWLAPGNVEVVQRRGDFIGKAQRTYKIVGVAMSAEQAGEDTRANMIWAKIFGPYFR